MSKTILKIENISKQYRLGIVGTGTIKDDLNRWWYKLRGKEDPFLTVGAVNKRSAKATEDYIWALKDINFEVQEGEVLGIIGKNGAGKSTLLKILSRVTSPTTGTIKTKGRIAALLEVGTGFHPELTGKENIYLNGAILGMTKTEITTKIDEIIDFSGCELYIDTPVKRYSSGMTVRLAFAVAAHLEPDILIIDEVLAVGDAEFQKKAIGKMQDISKGEGRTVLFVSHNMAAVKSLCTRAIVLEYGEIIFEGETDEAVDFYLKQGSSKKIRNHKIFSSRDSVFNDDIKPLSIGVKAKGKNFDDIIHADDEVEFIIEFEKNKKNFRVDTTIQIKNSQGNFILVTSSGMNNSLNNNERVGKIRHTVSFQSVFFDSEEFYINILFVKNSRNILLKLDDIISFIVINDKTELGVWMGKSVAPLKINLNWKNS